MGRNNGGVQCYNKLTKTTDHDVLGFLNQVGIFVEDIIGDVGLSCSPITGIGAGTDSCNIEPVCCENNSFGSLISIGCLPINIG